MVRSFAEWKRSATGRFLKAKGLNEKQLRRQFNLVKRFFRDTKILRRRR